MSGAEVSSSFKHNYGGYNNHGCRCDDCTEANRLYQREARRRRRARLIKAAMPDGRKVPVTYEAEHGSESTYTNYGCRCDACRAALNAAARARRANR